VKLAFPIFIFKSVIKNKTLSPRNECELLSVLRPSFLPIVEKHSKQYGSNCQVPKMIYNEFGELVPL